MPTTQPIALNSHFAHAYSDGHTNRRGNDQLSINFPDEPLIAKVERRTLSRQTATISVVIPAYNEQDTIAEVVAACHRGIGLLSTRGEVLVAASGCTDNTADIAASTGATVIEAPIGKGAAIKAGIAAVDGDIICLTDGDLQYYGDVPLVTLLAEPILQGIADACITNLYWRPIYPDQWMHGFFAPLAGHLFPELLPKAGSTPWSGQRAARRELWPADLPEDFTSDLALLLHWNEVTSRLRPVLTDDWFNPIRPKPEQMRLDFDLMVRRGITSGRITEQARAPLTEWFQTVQNAMSAYRHGDDDPTEYEQRLLRRSLQEFRRLMHRQPGRHADA